MELVKFSIDEELWYGVGSDEDAEAMAAKSLAASMGRVVGAKPFPIAAQKLTQLTQDPACSMDEVVAILESDSALSARLLRLVNSVGFSLRTPCTSVRHAATLVGIGKLNQVASTAAILDMYESTSERAAAVLEHATVVGALCRYLAFHFGLPPDELFTCGFLHDIGKLMLLETEGERYSRLLAETSNEPDRTYIAEREMFGFDHALLAGHVLAAWHIPHPVPKVVAWHHHVARAYAESSQISQMVSTLRLADALVFALQNPDTSEAVHTVARSEAASYLDISEPQLAALWTELTDLARRARAGFRGEAVEDEGPSLRPSRSSARASQAAANRASVPEATAAVGREAVPSLRPRQFPCVVCDGPSYAQKCLACQGYVCPKHIDDEDEWCTLCTADYEKAGIPAIRPVVSTILGATVGTLVAATFHAAVVAGTGRATGMMVAPTLILMSIGVILGVTHRWFRRIMFLRSRPNRKSLLPPGMAQEQSNVARHPHLRNPRVPKISIVGEAKPPASARAVTKDRHSELPRSSEAPASSRRWMSAAPSSNAPPWSTPSAPLDCASSRPPANVVGGAAASALPPLAAFSVATPSSAFSRLASNAAAPSSAFSNLAPSAAQPITPAPGAEPRSSSPPRSASVPSAWPRSATASSSAPPSHPDEEHFPRARISSPPSIRAPLRNSWSALPDERLEPELEQRDASEEGSDDEHSSEPRPRDHWEEQHEEPSRASLPQSAVLASNSERAPESGDNAWMESYLEDEGTSGW